MANILARGASRALRSLAPVLPQHIKRLILWCALYGKMCGAQTFTKEQCDKLNGALKLCKDVAAMALPAGLSKYIWQDLDDTVIVAKAAIRNGGVSEDAALLFVKSIPKWLRYASDTFILTDFELLMAVHQRPAV